MALSDFFQKFAMLQQLKIQQQAQRLDEQTRLGSLVQNFSTAIHSTAKEGRPAIIQAFAGVTGLDPQYLQELADATPEAVGTVQEKKTAAGAGQVSDQQVASAALTGRGQEANVIGDTTSQAFQQAAPNFLQQFDREVVAHNLTGQDLSGLARSGALAGLPPQTFQEIARVQGGLDLSAGDKSQAAVATRGQNLNYDIAKNNLAQGYVLGSVQNAIGQYNAQTARLNTTLDHDAQMAAVQARGNPHNLNSEQQLELVKTNKGIADALAKGGLSADSQKQYVAQYKHNLMLLGYDENAADEISGFKRVFKLGGDVQPSFFQHLGFGDYGTPQSDPQGYGRPAK